jgi:hypothetical protein
MRRQLSQTSIDSFRVLATKGSKFVPGNSGSALFDENGRVVGVLAFASRDGAEGYAIASSALPALMPALFDAAPVGKSSKGARPDLKTSAPPALAPVTIAEDIQRGRFGGLSSDGKVKLEVSVLREVGERYFVFTVAAVPIQGTKLKGPARFHLHDTYPRSLIEIRKPDENGAFALREVHSYGVYTIGCQVLDSDNIWHSLEFNLADLGKGKTPKLRAPFVNR